LFACQCTFSLHAYSFLTFSVSFYLFHFVIFH
jgi:hypothetical protein